ncbi:MAG: type II toxin-antitoxin system VapC family toxin [Candidatus Melainabacteria bacterium]|nr:type II toxin-antitoxin system VapC family toxin [Candidatus Melainabacteria bacterium]
MPYLLDTNICIALINRKPDKVLQRVMRCGQGDLVISSISVAELRFGAAKSQASKQAHQALDEFLGSMEIDDFDQLAATEYGAIRLDLERLGTPLGPLDTLLAAQAVAHRLTLVTNNEKEFRRVKQLIAIENWLL